VAVDVPRGECAADAVAALGRAGAGRGLGPRLGAGGGEAGGRAVDDLHGPAAGDGARVLARDAGGEVVEPVAVEVPRREGGAEEVACFSGLAGEVVVGPDLGAVAAEAVGPPVEHADGARVVLPQHGLAGDAYGEVAEPVAVEVPRGDGGAEEVVDLGRAEDAGAVLVPELVPGVGEAAGVAVEHVDGAGAILPARPVAVDADGEVVEPVAVEVARGEGVAEEVVGLRRAEDLGGGPGRGEEEHEEAGEGGRGPPVAWGGSHGGLRGRVSEGRAFPSYRHRPVVPLMPVEEYRPSAAPKERCGRGRGSRRRGRPLALREPDPPEPLMEPAAPATDTTQLLLAARDGRSEAT